MIAQRITALLLTAVAATTVAYMSLKYLVPVVAVTVALAGAMGWVRLRLTRERELIAILALATVFATAFRADPYEGTEAHGFFMYAFLYELGLFVLSVMALKVVVHARATLPVSLPLYGVVVMVCAGDVYADEVRDRVYQGLSLAFACVTALYFATSRRRLGRQTPRRLGMRRVLVVAALWVAVTGGIVGSTLLYRYQQEMNRLLLKMSLTFTPRSVMGFARDARLGSLNRLKTSRAENRTALRLICEGEPGYLRGLAFEKFAGSAWEQGGGKETRVPARDPPGNLPDLPDGPDVFEIFPARSPAWRRYEVWPSTDLTEAMFTPLHTAYLSADAPRLVVDESLTADAAKMPAGSAYYAFVPDPPPVGGLGEAARQRFTDLPALEPKVRELAETIFQGKTTAAEKIRAVEEHFRDHYRYSLGIRIPRGADPLTYFLLNRPAAHCEYFAAGAAVLLRLGGVPARYVTGFVARERNRLGGYWLARNKDAHAWVEAWDDSKGWVIVEATPPEGIPRGRDRGTMAYLWDYLKFRFQELRVVVFTGGFRGLMRWLGRRLLGLGRWLIGAAAGRVVTAGLAALLLVLLWRKLKPTRRRRRLDPLVAAMHRLLGRIDRRLARRGLVRSVGETLHQFAERVAASASEANATKRNGLAEAADWYVQYARVRYRPGRTDQAVLQLRREMPSL